MSTVEITSVDAQGFADEQAVLCHALERVPFDPEVYRRVEERAKAITERVRPETMFSRRPAR
ncbi:MAG TPA: hypothetical protein VGP68_02885 [Gemmataceae bacterium]|jgi:hypothetical protein|nr:hypothetical protein [Gemmataceae bacterium]